MSLAEQLVAIGIIHTFALLSPGPDFSALLQICLKNPKSRGFFCALGITAGITVHVISTLVGISRLISSFPQLYLTIRVLGACYIFYLGIKTLVSTFKTQQSTTSAAELSHTNLSIWQAFRIGVMTNILNPKAIVYFLSLVSQVMPASVNLSWKLSFSSLIIGLTGIWFSLVAVLFTIKPVKQAYTNFQTHIDRILGSILIGFAVHLALSI